MALDVIMALLLLAGGVMAFQCGFFEEISSKASYLFGFLFALLFTAPLSGIFERRVSVSVNPLVVSLCVYLVLFFFGLFMTRWLGHSLSGLFESAGLSLLDRCLGFLLGVIEMLAVLSIIFFALERQDFLDLSGVFGGSWLYREVLVRFRRVVYKLFVMLKVYRRG